MQQLQKTVDKLQLDQLQLQADVHQQNEFGQSQKQHQHSQRHFSPPPQVGSRRTPPLQNSSIAVNPAHPMAQVGAVMMSASTLVRPTSNQQQQKAPVHTYSTGGKNKFIKYFSLN